jgi:hypothetical protein
MRIIGCDLHARRQTVAMLDTTTGELVKMTLKHDGNNVREFYSQLPRPVCGHRSHGIDAVAHAVHRDPELQRFCRRKLIQKGLGKARVAVARKLGIRLWIMLRDQIEYNEFCRRGQKQQKSSDACAGMPETRYGATSHRPSD